MYYGVEKSEFIDKNKQALALFLSALNIVDFDEKAAVIYGKIRSDLERKGTVIGSQDMLIAAHAKSLNVELITNNVKEFQRVDGLKIDNWI